MHTRSRLAHSLSMALALGVAACGNSAMSPVAPTAATGSAVASAVSTSQTASDGFHALAKGGRRGGTDSKEDEKGKDDGKGGSDERDRTKDAPRGPSREDINLSGFVTAAGPSTLTVRGTAVTVNAATRIRHGNRTLTMADVHVGDHVQVKGVRVEGVVIASEIKVEDTGDDEDDLDDVRTSRVTGVVSGLTSTLSCPIVTFTVGTTTVTTSASTRFSGLACAALLDGLRVELRVAAQPDGTVAVQRVSVDDEDDTDDDSEMED